MAFVKNNEPRENSPVIIFVLKRLNIKEQMITLDKTMYSAIKRLLLSALVLGAAIGSHSIAEESTMKRMPFSLALGKSVYNKNCLACHGKEGVGSEIGPPLMHIYYEPSHHSDIAFYRAMTSGVKQHHWQFGDMQPVPGLNEKQMGKTIEYIRWLQRQQGIGL